MGDGTLTVSRETVRAPLMRARSDAQLTKMASAGSPAAFTAIYERHHQAVYRYCRTILGNDQDALDALQSTMTSAFEALPGESREIALKPWLFRIAHNEAISLLRRRRPEAGLDSVAEVASPELDPEARERAQRLFSDLELLTDRQRASLVMRELSGLEFSEIGAALETTAQGAKQSVYEARMALLDLERGREMSCDEICARISADDRRRRQARVVRAHLKSCSECSAFAAQLDSRRNTLAAIAPPLAAPAALSLLHGIIGGGGGGGGAAAAGGGGAAFGLGSGLAVKAATVAIVAAGAGGVAIEASKAGGGSGSDGSGQTIHAVEAAGPSGAAASEPGSGHAGESSSEKGVGSSAQDARARDDDAKISGAGNAGGNANAAGAHGAQNAQAESAAGDHAGGPDQAAAAAPANGDHGASENAPGHGSTPPGQGGTPPGQTHTPPGQSQTPPGQGQTPPGQGVTPPGQGGTPPGQGGTPPGQGGTPPGQAQTPPGQADPPGPAVTPPGQGQTPPGQGQTPPGQGGTPPGGGNGGAPAP